MGTKSLLIRLDRRMLMALDRVVVPGKRSVFIREAIRTAVRRAEYRAMREAYRMRPDSGEDVDDWTMIEKFDLS